VNSASFSLDGKEIITTSDDLTARVYPWETFAPIEDILALAGNRILRELTPEEQQKYLRKRFESSSSSLQAGFAPKVERERRRRAM